MFRFFVLLSATFIALAPAAQAGEKSKKGVCKSGQKYSAKRCGGPRKNIPNYCFDGKRVAGGYFIKKGGCYQDNGGGE
ncbi:MAG: hypothetical protein KDJ45_15085 [Hyphomicrobiaceae bacterium]|nr:hypothetical protein [Hyphomicrobiaceae bacterium]MCC0010549.1 hypothetical protein [Hyphomicrobiaceae bacterium]